jgi:hypothetical protein
MRLVVVAMALAISGRAYAGFECDREASIQAVEAAARSKAKLEEARYSSSFMCAGWGTAAERVRVLAACRRILDRDGDTSPCVDLVALYGAAKLGDHDIFTLVSKEVGKPLEYDGSFRPKQTELLAKLGDPRGAAVIIEIWKATLPLADEHEKRHRSMSSWSSWRQGAAEALGTLGSVEDIGFLEEQAKATRDSYVADACRAAIKAITRRAKPAPTTPSSPSATPAPGAPDAKPAPSAPSAPSAPTAPDAKPAPGAPTAPAGPTQSPR